METMTNKTSRLLLAGSFLVLTILTITACKKDKDNDNVNEQSFTQVNLVASSASYAGARVDPRATACVW